MLENMRQYELTNPIYILGGTDPEDGIPPDDPPPP